MKEKIQAVLTEYPTRLDVLAKKAGLPEKDCKSVLRDMSRKGFAVMYKGGWRNTAGLTKKTGIVRRVGGGFELIAVDETEGDARAWMTPKTSKFLLAGDVVSAWLFPDGKGGCEAVPYEFVSRSNPTEHARVKKSDAGLSAILERRIDEVEISIGDSSNLDEGDYIEIRIESKDFLSLRTKARVMKKICNANEKGAEAALVSEIWNFEEGFSDASMTEAMSAKLEVYSTDRSDLRKVAFATIDGPYTKDLDDALFAKKTEDGWEVSSAIADVSHFVKPGSAMDADARRHMTSIYLPGKTIPMLPEKMSNGLCSLSEDAERLAIVCTWKVEKEGSIGSPRFEKALIRSAARLTYEQVSDFIEKNGPLPDKVRDSISALSEAALAMSKGPNASLRLNMEGETFDMKLNKQGKIECIERTERRAGDFLVEECMLATNFIVAQEIARRGGKALFRNHGLPVGAAASLNETLGKWGMSIPDSSVESVRRFLEEARASGMYESVRSEVLRIMEPAVYSTNNEGHFSLALSSYLHFTSPIRRYPDLVAHRILKGLLFGEQDDMNENMEALAAACTRASKNSKDAENEARKILRCEFAKRWEGIEQTARVSSVSERGVFVVLEPSNLEGFIPGRSTPWKYMESENKWRDNTEQSIEVGSKMKASIKKADFHSRNFEIDLPDSPKPSFGRR